jgi:enterochelin esterase family protein
MVGLILTRMIAAAMCMTAPAAAQAAADYALTADSLATPDIAHGKLEGPFELHSKIFAGTVRRYWVYVPADYDPSKPPNLLVFQDGQRATNPEGALRIPNVLDKLIAKKDIPSTLGVFVTPGNLSSRYPDDLGMRNPDHRAAEYDSLSDAYTRMLTGELLPEVTKRWHFTEDPKRRAIGGTSSGAIAAFTVGWHRPDAFANIISFIGSYTSIGYAPATPDRPMVPGGDLYPTLIRKSPIRPLSIFLQDGSADLDNEHGNWFLANQQMLAALTWANGHADTAGDKGPRYDIAHIWGEGAHSDAHGGRILPDVLRWFWGDQQPIIMRQPPTPPSDR